MRAISKTRRKIGVSMIVVGGTLLGTWIWLYLGLQPQLGAVSAFQKKYSATGGSFLASWDLKAQRNELEAIFYRNTIEKCKEIHDCSQPTINMIKGQYDPQRWEFDRIATEAQEDWSDANPQRNTLERKLLSLVCYVESLGHEPEEIGDATALTPGGVAGIFLLFGGYVLMYARKPEKLQVAQLGISSDSHSQDSPEEDKTFMTEIAVKCSGCQKTYRIGADAAVVTSDGVGADFGKSMVGGNKSDPDLVAPYPPGRSPSSDVQQEVQRLLRAKSGKTERYWKCNPCGTVNRY